MGGWCAVYACTSGSGRQNERFEKEEKSKHFYLLLTARESGEMRDEGRV